MNFQVYKRVRGLPSPMVKPASNVTKFTYPSPEEIKRRDEIIIKLVKDCPYKPGDKVRPVSDATFDREGPYEVIAIAQNYQAYRSRKHDWPQSDNPMIVHSKCIKDGAIMSATTNYFLPLNVS